MGLFRTDGKRPDGVTLVPWQSGKSLCWDVTVTCPLAESYIDRAALEAGAAAEMAATRKEEKYVDLDARYIFEPIAVDTLGVFNASAPHLLILEGGSRDQLPLPKDFDFNTALQLTVCRLQTAQTDDRTQFCIYFSIFFYLPRDYMYRGLKNNNKRYSVCNIDP